MNRFKEHKDTQVVDRIKAMIGEDDLNSILVSQNHIDAFCSVFERNLKELGSYTLKFMMRDDKNIRDNAFFFCGRHPKGFEKIKEAMWNVDPVHGNAFSTHKEMKDSIHATLFDAGAQTQPLSKMLLEQFRERNNVSVEEIFKWVIEKTDVFLPKHARVELEKLYQQGDIISIIDPQNRQRRKNAWPERLLLTFRG